MIIIDNERIRVEKLELEIENTGHVTNTYIVKDKETLMACVVDPAFNENAIEEKIQELQVTLDSVIITHSHADHIAALAKLIEGKDVKVYVHTEDYDGLYDKVLNEEDVVATKVLPVDKEKVVCVNEKENIIVGNITYEVIHTPGHTKGSMVLFDEKNNILFSGDTIFENTYGRTDLITGSHEDMKRSLDKLFERFDEVEVLPGHGNEFNLKNSKRKIRLLFAFKG